MNGVSIWPFTLGKKQKDTVIALQPVIPLDIRILDRSFPIESPWCLLGTSHSSETLNTRKVQDLTHEIELRLVYSIQ